MSQPQTEPSVEPAVLPARIAVAVGLIVAGLAALVVAWILGQDLARPQPGPGWVRTATVVLILLIGAQVWALLDRGRLIFRVVSLATVIVAVAISLLSVVALVDQYRRGFPGQATMLAAVGGLAVAVGALMSVRLDPTTRWRPRRSGVVAVASAVVLVAAVAVPLTVTAPDWPLTATTAEPAEAAPIPESVSRVAWSTPIDGQIKDVVAAGAGVVLLVDDGVVALDGTTGQIRWRRHRPGAEARELVASPDGRTLLAWTRPGGKGSLRREVIDALTGQVRFTAEKDGLLRFGVDNPTNLTYIGTNDDLSEFSGYSVIDGSRLWTTGTPDGCRTITNNNARHAVGNGLLLPLMCGREEPDGDFTEFRYVALDGTTGRQRWHRTVPLDPPERGLDVDTDLAMDGRHLRVTVRAGSRGLGKFVVDTDTGTELPTHGWVEPKAAGIAVERPAQLAEPARLIELTSGASIATGPVLTCALENYVAFLRSGVVCTDPALDSLDELVHEGTIDLAAGRFGETTIQPVPVALGGPFVEEEIVGDNLRLVAAPGAVVVLPAYRPADGRQVNVVGLR